MVKVIQISPDTEQDENDKRIVFYKILVETEQGAIFKVRIEFINWFLV